MKKILYLSLFIFHFSFSQTWEAVGGGIQGGNDSLIPVYSLCAYNGKLYSGGCIAKAGNVKVNNIACWNGTKWDSLRSGTNGHITALGVYHNALCVGGYFFKAGKRRVDYMARWVDTANTIHDWYALGATLIRFTKLDGSPIRTFVTYQDDLYLEQGLTFGAQIDEETRGAHVHAKLNDGKWSFLPIIGQLPREDSGVGSYNAYDMQGGLAVYKGKLYSNFMYHTHYYEWADLVTWNGQKWENMNAALKSSRNGSALINTMVVYDSTLYIAGAFFRLGDKRVNNIVAWDGKSWSDVGGGIPHGSIRSMAVYHGKLYVGGVFDSVGGSPANNIAVWDGHSWSALGEGLTNGTRHAAVQSLCVYNDELYAAGFFSASGKVPVLNIAKLNLKGTKPITPKKKGNG